MRIKDSVVETKFEPVTLEIAFESLEELEVFWGMTNAPEREIEENMRANNKIDNYIIDKVTTSLFRWADGQIRKYD